MHELDVLTASEQKRLLCLDEALSMLDGLYFSVQSKTKRFARYLSQGSNTEGADLLKDIKLRLETLYQRLIEGEIGILGSVIAYYDIYFGPFAEQRSKKPSFERTRGGRRECDRVTSVFHAFAVEYTSILDAIMKLFLTLVSETVPLPVKRCDSYGSFADLMRRDPQIKAVIERHALLGPWLIYEGLMTSIKDRRDLIVHHRYLALHPSATRTGSGYLEMEFWSPEVHRSGRKQFDVKETILLRYNYFCRAALYVLFRLLNENLSNLLQGARQTGTRCI